uniref:Uncharacterized protein n=1 Tax=Panagrolaimus sp. PS1159 TaxID=55785 RepID=A0AC35ERM3_9BILA
MNVSSLKCIEAFNHYLYCEIGGEVSKEVHVRLGIVHKICGDFEKSRKHFCCALDDLRKTPLFSESEIRFHIAHCFDAAGDSKAAFEEYTKLKSDPIVQQDKRLLANVFRALGK